MTILYKCEKVYKDMYVYIRHLQTEKPNLLRKRRYTAYIAISRPSNEVVPRGQDVLTD